VIVAPIFIEPMELLAVTRLPEGPEWSYEVKLDGYRAQAIQGARSGCYLDAARTSAHNF